jgi:hypothetical protein
MSHFFQLLANQLNRLLSEGRNPFDRLAGSLSAYSGAAVLFKLADVLVAAAQIVPCLVRGFSCATGFDAHSAEKNDGTAIEWCADSSASRWIAPRSTR